MEQPVDSRYQPIDPEALSADEIARPSVSYWQDAWRRFKSDKMAVFGLVVIVIITLFAIFGPILCPYGYEDADFFHVNEWPSREHWFGTDALGRDLYVRVLYGARISLSIGVVAALVNMVIGVLYGGIAGFCGGLVDNIMMRIVDIIYSLPDVLIVILLSVAIKDVISNSKNELVVKLGAGMISIFIVFGLLYWVGMARQVRGQILSIKEQEYVLAARAMGASPAHIIRKHMIPNCVSVIIITAAMQIPSAIFTESFLSFVGMGVSMPMPSLGSLASDARGGLVSYPYMLLFPALSIFLIVLSFNLLGNGLRDAFDPKLRS